MAPSHLTAWISSYTLGLKQYPSLSSEESEVPYQAEKTSQNNKALNVALYKTEKNIHTRLAIMPV